MQMQTETRTRTKSENRVHSAGSWTVSLLKLSLGVDGPFCVGDFEHGVLMSLNVPGGW